MQVSVAQVSGIHRNCSVSQHCLRTRRGHHNEIARATHHRVTNLVELPLCLLVNYLEVAHRRHTPRAPVHDVLAAIDQSFLIQPDERLAHSARHALVHREVLARPVHRRPEALHLLQNHSTVVLLPAPHARFKGFTPDVAAVDSLTGKLALHHELGRDAGMVGSRQPQSGNPLHPLPANDDVDLRVLQHVTHVQVASHVRRRERQGEGRLRGICSRGVHVEQLFANPVFGPAWLDRARFISLGKIVRHATRLEFQKLHFDITRVRKRGSNRLVPCLTQRWRDLEPPHPCDNTAVSLDH